MAEWQDVISDALKEYEGAYKAVTKALTDNGMKLQDVATGKYVSTSKHEDEMNKLRKEMEDIKNAPNPLTEEIEKLKADHAVELQNQRKVAQDIIKSQAVSEKISKLGISNELEAVGMKSLIKLDDIKMDDNYSITGGLDEQIDALKSQYGSSIEKKTTPSISTGMSVQSSASKGTQPHKYQSLDEIKGLTQEQVNADLPNIMQQLGSLK